MTVRRTARALALGTGLLAAAALLPIAPGTASAQDGGVPADDPYSVGVHTSPDVPTYVVDPAPEPPTPAELEGERVARANAAGAVDTSQTFLLHSRPGSQRTIYLDFNGHTASGTRWSDGAPPDPIVATAWDIEGGAGTITAAEHEQIQGIWARVSEDYAPWDVDVTTQDPGAAAIDRANSSDQVFGTRAVITDLPGLSGDCGCGGQAFIDVFDWTFNSDTLSHAKLQPAWIFAPNLFSEKDIAEAVSHEVGHNLGLTHDGTTTEDYYEGIPNTLFAPIMGVAYDHPVSQWSKGEYPDAQNLDPFEEEPTPIVPMQDDLAIIGSSGVLPVADDHTNADADATLLGPSPWATTGLVGTAADVDRFRYVASGAGQLVVNVSPAAKSPNLDVLLTLRSGGSQVAANNPAAAYANVDVATGMAASITYAVPAAGTYYVTVEGVGQGSTATGGYSDYASIGRYTLTGTFTPSGPVATYTPGDFDADGTADEAVFRPGNGTWYLNTGTTKQWGANGDVPVPGQWDADANEDVAVFRPSTGYWYVDGVGSKQFGASGDIPVAADYDADGSVEHAVFRPSTGRWFVDGIAGSTQFGTNGDVPVPGQWDADPQADFAVFRPSTGQWFVHGAAGSVKFGASGDVPVPGQWDADPALDRAVFRKGESRWYVEGTAGSVKFGTTGDIPVPAQWDGDSLTDIAVFRRSVGRWFVDPSGSVAFGASTDVPVTLPYAARRLL